MSPSVTTSARYQGYTINDLSKAITDMPLSPSADFERETKTILENLRNNNPYQPLLDLFKMPSEKVAELEDMSKETKKTHYYNMVLLLKYGINYPMLGSYDFFEELYYEPAKELYLNYPGLLALSAQLDLTLNQIIEFPSHTKDVMINYKESIKDLMAHSNVSADEITVLLKQDTSIVESSLQRMIQQKNVELMIKKNLEGSHEKIGKMFIIVLVNILMILLVLPALTMAIYGAIKKQKRFPWKPTLTTTPFSKPCQNPSLGQENPASAPLAKA